MAESWEVVSVEDDGRRLLELLWDVMVLEMTENEEVISLDVDGTEFVEISL